MKLKTETINGVEYAVLNNGMPVYVHADNKEIPFDAPNTVAKISQLNGEARGHRERAEAAEAKLKPYEAIPDPAAALAAMDMVTKIDQKKLIDGGKIDEVRAEAKKAFDQQLSAVEQKYAPVVKERDTLQGQLVAEKVGGAFTRSKFIAEKMAIPADLVQAAFGSAFKLENGNVIAYDKDGKQIFSRAKPGEVAEFDEAIEILVDNYPRKEHILKGSGASGSGAGGGGSGAGGKKQLPRTQFDRMDPMQQRAHIKGGGTVVDA